MALLLTALLVAPPGCGRPADRPNVLLIVVDTLRADHVGWAGYGRDTTPRLDAFAAGALRFSHAQTPRAKTSPAVASIMTGLYPHDHGVRDLTTPMRAEVPVLAESFRREGWATCGIVGNFVLQDARSGLARGFETWVEDLPDVTGVPPEHVPQRTARSLTDGALVALGLQPAAPTASAGPHDRVLPSGRPWFLYLHYMDPHGAYAPPAAHDVFAPDASDPSAPVGARIPEDGRPPHPLRVAAYNIPDACQNADGTVDAACVRARYDGEIRYADAEIGRLLDELRASGALDHTYVVVVADHGEGFGEHNDWFEHGFTAYEETCRVPLLLAGPGVPAGATEADVSLTDLAPTLADLAGLAAFPPAAGTAQAAVRGRSLAGLVRRPPARPEARAVFCEKIEGADLDGTVQQKAVRLGDWKLIRRYGHVTTEAGRELRELEEELFDLARDPHEAQNLAASPPAGAPLAWLRAELLRFAAVEVRFEDLAAQLAEQSEQLRRDDPEAYAVLKAMGYVR